jgi:predicted phosphate transport protein (TIGR00153 family)
MPDPSRTPTSPPSRPRFREMVGRNIKALSLVPREQRFYDLFEQQATILVSASVLLKEALGDMGNLPARQREIKDLERLGDKYTYETMRTLNETFVTPFDHEDISALAAGLDDILDYIEEIADTVNLYKIMVISRPASELADLLAQSVAQLEQAVGKLRSGKKDGEYIIEVHRLEDIGDSASRRAIAELFQGQRDPLEVIKLKDLYSLLEVALDRCEDVANVIENIAIKNA